MNVGEFIRKEAGNEPFVCTFRKRTNGRLRRMSCQLGVKEGVTGQGQPYDPEDKDLLTVWDTDLQEYRNVNLRAIVRLEIKGKVYRAKDLK